MSFIDVLITVVFLLILMVPGFLLVKTKLLGENADSVLSSLVLYVCQPALVFMAFQKTDYSSDIAINMLIVAGLALLLHIVAIVLFSIIFRNKDNQSKINCVKFASVFGNCGYMGLPFLQSLFSSTGFADEILIYGGVVIAIFNLLTWSIGVYIMTGDKKQINIKNALVNPTVIALILGVIAFFIIKVPIAEISPANTLLGKVTGGFMKSVNYLGEMVTPLAMTVIGVKMAKISFKRLFTDVWAYIVSFNKLIVVGIITILTVAFLPIDNVVKYSLFFLLSMPSATNTVLFAVRFNGDADSGAVFVLLSTILSIITIPLMYLVMSGVFGIPI